MGEQWRFDYAERLVKTGWQLWRMSDKKRMPTPDEVAALDPVWVDDIMFMEKLWKWVNPQRALPGQNEITPPPQQPAERGSQS